MTSLKQVNNTQTSFASAMGARIDVCGPPRGMYLIIGANVLPEKMAEKAGGLTVLALNGRKLLAVLPFEGYLMMKHDTRIAHIGPVTVDMKRLTAMAGRLAAPGAPRTTDA